MCAKPVLRGGNMGVSYNNTNLINHLQRFHGKEYQRFVKGNGKDTRQPKLIYVFQKHKKLTADSPKAKGIIFKLFKFVSMLPITACL